MGPSFVLARAERGSRGSSSPGPAAIQVAGCRRDAKGGRLFNSKVTRASPLKGERSKIKCLLGGERVTGAVSMLLEIIMQDEPHVHTLWGSAVHNADMKGLKQGWVIGGFGGPFWGGRVLDGRDP
eukprot:scaffold155935_cov17-Tisochrysis_lutea.AAC.1